MNVHPLLLELVSLINSSINGTMGGAFVDIIIRIILSFLEIGFRIVVSDFHSYSWYSCFNQLHYLTKDLECNSVCTN